MRVLVTGASGFLGGAACAELLRRGHRVSALVRRPGTQPSGTEPVLGDLRDGTALGAALVAARAETVVHLAAEIGSQRDPAKIREVNVQGMRRLLDACRAAGVRRFVFASMVVTRRRGGRGADRGHGAASADRVRRVQTRGRTATTAGGPAVAIRARRMA